MHRARCYEHRDCTVNRFASAMSASSSRIESFSDAIASDEVLGGFVLHTSKRGAALGSDLDPFAASQKTTFAGPTKRPILALARRRPSERQL
jgi:hypothetical protein